MPKRITIRVPEPCEVDIDVVPTEITISGEYGGHAEEVTIQHVKDGRWRVAGSIIDGRDEATEHAVQMVCRSIAQQVATAKVRASLT